MMCLVFEIPSCLFLLCLCNLHSGIWSVWTLCDPLCGYCHPNSNGLHVLFGVACALRLVSFPHGECLVAWGGGGGLSLPCGEAHNDFSMTFGCPLSETTCALHILL